MQSISQISGTLKQKQEEHTITQEIEGLEVWAKQRQSLIPAKIGNLTTRWNWEEMEATAAHNQF